MKTRLGVGYRTLLYLGYNICCRRHNQYERAFYVAAPLKEQRYQLRFNYLGYKETILTLYPTKESFVRLGDIRLDKQVEQLQEVTVLGSNEIKMEDKTMYYLTRAQLRHAYNGYNTVEMLMIPGVTANSSSISYFGKNVLLCIDGREATSGEVQNLNPNDIKRIDFLFAKPSRLSGSGCDI